MYVSFCGPSVVALCLLIRKIIALIFFILFLVSDCTHTHTADGHSCHDDGMLESLLLGGCRLAPLFLS